MSCLILSLRGNDGDRCSKRRFYPFEFDEAYVIPRGFVCNKNKRRGDGEITVGVMIQ